jgi:hypothetical protein
MAPGTRCAGRGASSNSPTRFCREDEVVKLSTIKCAGLDGVRELFAAPFVSFGTRGRSSLGDSGEKEGKEVNDLSDIELAELDM